MQEFNTEKETQDTRERDGQGSSPIAGFRTAAGGGHSWRRIALYGLVGVLFVVVVGALLVSRSVPGDTLYGVKTRFMEGTLSGGQAADQVDHMRARLEELKSLHAEGELTAEARATITGNVWDHVRRFKELVTAEDTTVAPDDALGYVSDITSIVRTQERIIEFGDDQDAIREIERARAYVVDLREDLIVRLAAEGDGTMARDFIADHLDVLSEALGRGDLSRSRIAVTEDYVEDVLEALIADDLESALEAVTKAEELIELDRYIRDVSEDPTLRG